MSTAAETKAALRVVARLRRMAAAEASPFAAATIASIVSTAGIIPQGAVIAAYVGMGDEIDPLPLLEALALRHVCALPTIGRDRVLTFRQWRPGTPLVAGRYGIPEPALDSPAVRADIVLVPLLAFDRTGHRLGYGGGYYDATLAALRAAGPVTAIGLAYAAQEVERLPADLWDQRLDMIATERELSDFGIGVG